MGFLKEPSHIIIVVLVLVILFGSRRLPDAARGLGRSMRIFKSEINQMKEDDKATPATEAARRQAQADELRRQADALVADEPIEGRVMTPQQREQNGYQTRNDV